MATKIRLQRHGKKGAPYYHVVVADSRAKRDGRYIERLGFYNPNTNPATIDINFDKTLHWVQVGAEMSDTARAILSYKGVLYKNHLINGIKKGALTEADVEKKFDKWLKEKEAKVAGKSDAHAAAIKKTQDARLAKEKEVNETRAKELAAQAVPDEEEVVEETATEEVNEAPKAEEVPAEEKVEEAPKEEAPKAEAKSEETPKEEPKTEAKEEAPKAEEKAAEAPKKEDEKAEEK